jgi:hypothetical protein
MQQAVLLACLPQQHASFASVQAIRDSVKAPAAAAAAAGISSGRSCSMLLPLASCAFLLLSCMQTKWADYFTALLRSKATHQKPTRGL